MRELIIKLIRNGHLVIHKDVDSYNDVLYKFLDEIFPNDTTTHENKLSGVYSNNYFFGVDGDDEWNVGTTLQKNIPFITLSEILNLPEKDSVILSAGEWNFLTDLMNPDMGHSAHHIRIEFRNAFNHISNKNSIINDIKLLMENHGISTEDLK